MSGTSRRNFVKTAAVGALLLPTSLRSALRRRRSSKVGVIHQGAIADTGWEYFQAQAWRSLQKDFSRQGEGDGAGEHHPDSGRRAAVSALSTQGHKLCFGTTFSHFASLKKLAPTLKKSHFECCAGIEASDNLGVFEARHYEGTYLTGIAAGRMTKSNILGWVGAFPVPQVIYSLNAFMLGARSVNPNATLKSFGSTPGSTRKGEGRGGALVAQGADVISGSPNTPVQGLACEEKGVWAIGSTGDFSAYVKKGQLTSFELDWSAAHIEAAKAVMAGNWKPSTRWRGLGPDGFVKMTTRSRIAIERRGGNESAEAAIVSGKLKPYTGPIKDQNGTQKVAASTTITDAELKGINWLVEGVQGKLPTAG